MLKRERERNNHQSTKWSPICESWSQVEEKRIKNREYREIRAGHARHSIIVDLDHWNDEPGTNQVTRDACKRCSLGRFGRRLIPSGRTVCDGAPWIEIFAGRSVPVGDSGSKRADRRISCPRNRKRSAHTHTERERERESADLRFYEGHRYYGREERGASARRPVDSRETSRGPLAKRVSDVLVNLSSVISSAVTSRVHLLGCP